MANEHEKFNSAETLDLDDLLPQVGEFGRYQKLLLCLVCLPACIPCGFCAFNQLFMAVTPQHWCKVPSLWNFTQDDRKNFAIPKLNDTFANCERYAVNWTSILNDFDNDVVELPNSSWPVEKCLDGWEFEQVDASIVTDFGLFCEKDIYPTLGLVSLNLGGPIGVFLFGVLNDKIGRKISFFLCLTVLLIGSILTITAQDFWWWAGSRAIVGLSIPAIYQIPFIISLELVGPNYRSFVTVLICLFYTVGLMVLAAITYLVRNWVHLATITSLPFTLYYFYWFFLPESPRWLLARGRFEEAARILETLARINGKEFPAHFKQELKHRISYKRTKSEEDEFRKSASCFDLCILPNMRLKTLLITFSWFANELVYVGLSYYGPALGSNEYMSFFLSCLVEIPSSLICYLVMDRWGRRWPLCLCMIISGLSLMVTVFLPNDAPNLLLFFYLLAKSSISASMLIIFPFSGELFPTQVRGVGIGVSAYIGGMGLIILPFITYLGSEMLVLPLIIMGIIAIIGGLSGLRLPETLHHKLPQTLEDGEEFGKHFAMEDCLRCIPLKPDAAASSYEDLEMETMKNEVDEETPLGNNSRVRRISLQRLARQSSIMDTAKDADGTMKITYWF